MLLKVTLNNAATFEDGESLDELKKLNFIFGTNGTGKTTISRLLKDNSKYPGSTLEWSENAPIKVHAYNSDFVEENFRENKDIQGVFTLGKTEGDDLENLRNATEEAKTSRDKVALAKKTLDGDGQKVGLRDRTARNLKTFTDLCWKEKDNFPKLREGFQGSLNSKDVFKDNVLEKYNDRSKTKFAEQNELENEAAALFGEGPSEVPEFAPLDLSLIKPIESNEIFRTQILGSSDTYLSEMISKLGNADWVRGGMHFHEENDDHCPFCQQKTDEPFKEALKKLFDEHYENALSSIKECGQNYRTQIEFLENLIYKLPRLPETIVENEAFKALLNNLILTMKLNLEKIREKWKEPSKEVALAQSDNLTAELQKLSEIISEKVILHNKLVVDSKAKIEELKNKVWRFFIEKIKSSIETFISEQNIFDAEIKAAEKIIEEENEKLEVKGKTIEEISARGTSIKPTLIGINKLLEGFGFNSFRLALTEKEDAYQIKRENGDLACTSLSEGERTFIAFLYFYHLITGAYRTDEFYHDKIVVIDDPISSLDSDILFIVSVIVREIARSACLVGSQVKQVFILTHNTYFHNNLSEGLNRKPFVKNHGFWIARKDEKKSYLTKYETNPISNTYKLLWDEVKRASVRDENVSPILQNAVRRILEHYFEFLGGCPLKKLDENFPNEEKMLCNSMIAWAHMGSHGKIDDLHITPVHCSVKTYLAIFRKIFDFEGHISHFMMMMGDFAEEENEEIKQGEA